MVTQRKMAVIQMDIRVKSKQTLTWKPGGIHSLYNTAKPVAILNTRISMKQVGSIVICKFIIFQAVFLPHPRRRGGGYCHHHVWLCGYACGRTSAFRFRTIYWKALAQLFCYFMHTSLRGVQMCLLRVMTFDLIIGGG